MIKNTIYTQRSLDNSWTIDTNHGIPSGVIVDLQITMPYTDTDVMLTSCRMDSNRQLSMIFQCGEQRIAWTTASEQDVGVPMSMECAEDITAHILLGALPSSEAEYIKSPVTVNPGLVHYYDKDAIPATSTKLTVIADGNETFNEELSSDITIRLGTTDLYCSVSTSGEAAIGTDWSGAQLLGITREDELIPVNPWIRSINHIFPDKDGNITVKLSAKANHIFTDEDGNSTVLFTEGLSAAATATDNASCITLSATDELNKKLAPEDLLDKYLMPNEGRDYSYYPLDDVYMSGDTLGRVRNTFGTIGAKNYKFPCIQLTGGTLSVEQMALRTFELLYDKDPAESETTTEGSV